LHRRLEAIEQELARLRAQREPGGPAFRQLLGPPWRLPGGRRCGRADRPNRSPWPGLQ
jgi:hypothetical protein